MEHYFSKKPTSIPKDNTIQYRYNSIDFKFITSSSVFSKKKVDKGTNLLIKESKIAQKAKILDIGCGYGPVGIVLSRIHPETQITMSDINERAISLAKKNLKLNNTGAAIVKSGLYDNIEGKFDIILSNPPQSAGKKLCFKLIEESIKHLNKNGSLQLVARHNKGGKDLSKKMEEIFGNLKTLGRQSGYHVYYSEKKIMPLIISAK
ncbi:MAG: class I SAM-dependent methyltransferase [Nanoarchaeota archaeon]|nr:class I SAM-dependent methyltransferase [Nanoarchaeota archaeon]